MKPKIIMLAGLLFATAPVLAQNPNAQMQGNFPVAPTGLQNLPLADGPWDYRTGEDMNIHVELVTRMEYAMALQFLPDASLLVVTRPGKLYLLKDGNKTEIPGGPEVFWAGESGGIGTIHGYMDLALHPDFASEPYVYISFHRQKADGVIAGAVGRGRWTGSALADWELVFDSADLNGNESIAFGSDGKLYISTPDRDSQSLDSLGGKILRLDPDGSIPADNPFVNTPGARPEIYSYGHRYTLGMTLHPGTGELWQSENGPNGGDEINILKPGANYGWPLVSYGRTYNGPWQNGVEATHAGYPTPVVYWMPSVAVSGLTFYTGDKLNKWQGDLFVGALREGEVNGTGHLERILFNSRMEELRRESLLVDLHKRVRDVAQGPDGYLYLALEDRDGGVLRIMPAE